MPRRIFQGTVVSDKGDKTVVLKVDRTFLHPLLRKTVLTISHQAGDDGRSFGHGGAPPVRRRARRQGEPTLDFLRRMCRVLGHGRAGGRIDRSLCRHAPRTMQGACALTR